MIVVVGAGAAGLVAAAFASTPDRPALLVERTADGGRKILISGGGRCNVLPAALEPERFVTTSPPHLVRRLLRAWPLEHQKAFFEHELGVPLKFESASRKYFPASDRARDVRDALVAFARRRGVQFRYRTIVTGLSRAGAAAGAADGVVGGAGAAPGWRLETTAGAIAARAVILATGGLSVPQTGSDGTGLRIAATLGHTVHPLYPALAPLVSDPPRHAGLAGVSLDVRIRVGRGKSARESRGGFLFTHRGYSGPAAMGACGKESELRVSWSETTAQEWHKIFASAGGAGGPNVLTIVAARVPERLAAQLMLEAGVPADRRTSDLTRSERIALVDLLTAYPLPVTGDEGYRKAEVTGGGVALDEVKPDTLESRRHPGLFLCGEMLDAWGPIGGHNFAWAWSTGRAAGLGAAAIDRQHD